MPTISFTEYLDCDEEITHQLPAKWTICGSCSGNGTTTAHIENDGGGFTYSEWNELDEEFQEDYLSGRYDRSCQHCSGTGKVLELDRDSCKPELLKLYDDQKEDEYEYQQMCEMERKMGA